MARKLFYQPRCKLLKMTPIKAVITEDEKKAVKTVQKKRLGDFKVAKSF